jgi:uncharacterized protein YcbK (DUF882 family)
MKGLERNFAYYAGKADVRLNDNMHFLSEKSKFNLRTEAQAIARDLIEIGYNRNGTARNLTEQDIRSLVSFYQAQNFAVGTIQNKMTVVRHILSSAENKIEISNVALGISAGRDVLNSANINKACALPSAAQLSSIADKTLSGAIMLAGAYGLRKDESLYVVHALTLKHTVSQNNKLIIPRGKGKGTRPRTFEMRDGGATLRAVAQSVAGLKTYTKIEKSRIEHFRNRLENEVRKVDNLNMHGLRHAYAQERYFSLTGGLLAPTAGGLQYSAMSDVQKESYHAACQVISLELGHTRETISRTYLGK